MTETITDVRVFDGDRRLDGSWDVTVDGAIIATVEPLGAGADSGERTDGRGAALLPGLLDAHVHLRDANDLHALARSGVTKY